MPILHSQFERVLDRVRERSRESRSAYLADIQAMAEDSDSSRAHVSCSNMAHAAAAAGPDQDDILGTSSTPKPNIGIITAYNDMLSAHQPFEGFPTIIRSAARVAGGTAQVAGGVPAMCDGVTQGRPGMELSLLSRDVIAMATAIGLSHNVYDAALCLGVCDKIVPGLVMGALQFGHLPTIFVPAGPMSSGLPNEEKAAVRRAFAKGEASREDLLKSEVAAYHGPGTCTFYGTANSNQMLMEIMGLHLPGAALVHPHSDLRHALTIAATEQAVALAQKGDQNKQIGVLLDERAFVNAIVGLHATGGSTNHTLHLPAMAAAAGIKLMWEDFADLSDIVPLLARVYPNGSADVNHFHAAGGMGFVISQLLHAGLLDGTAGAVGADSIADSAIEPILKDNRLSWRPAPDVSADPAVLATTDAPHAPQGGLKMLTGNIGDAVIKISAVDPSRHHITAPAAVFHDEAAVKAAYQAGDLNRDVIVVVRAQGPMANGMPELHSLTPLLSNLQEQGFVVGLVTDGRMSGASGKVPAAIHVSPEAVNGGAIGRIKEGDMITINAIDGVLAADADLGGRPAFDGAGLVQPQHFGRGLFAMMRQTAAHAQSGGGLNQLG